MNQKLIFDSQKMTLEEDKPLLHNIFHDCRIVGLAGEKSSGKTNNLVFLIKDYREHNKDVPIYFYGIPESVKPYLFNLGCKEISSVDHLVGKKDCILIIDEMQKLHMNDRRNTDNVAAFIDFVYHNNVYVIFSSPNIREFNSVIGGFIEKWLLKTVLLSHCVNGSQLKRAIENYKGSKKEMVNIVMSKSEILVINEHEEVLINCEYVQEADNKLDNKELF